MSTGHVLLGLLSRGQQHGYDLKRAHDDRFPAAKPMAYGQVYASLERLHRQGFVEPVAVQRVDGPDRTVYAITATGRAELTDWIETVETPFVHVANPLATKVTVALLVTDTAYATTCLERQRASHLDAMRRYTRAKTDPSLPIHEVLAADYAIAHLDADLQWMESALQRVAALGEAIAT
ncbi:PadR family transcriptional regulator [Leekyejoonella antrihumi]|uniref:PadR family transcriptional regulator n=1 Tax=Leekyejoonella antrihumi TaxID=1660198 RepID=A0A563DYA6_9MICO|nr:PadR family transcriptional regulator [Leekyejoonella antrihumi]TWP34952.1 PadR family transcriptional regulator [Leekyejoonella antrihumi]